MTELSPEPPFDSDPYEVLGVAPGAAADHVKSAYFALVRAHPPERDPVAFKKIRAAYDRVNTPEKRFETDMLRFETWQDNEPIRAPDVDLALRKEDVIRAARAVSDLARNDWRRDFREVDP